MTDEKPNATSSDHDAMAGYWSQAAAMLGGVTTMRAAGKKYLPKFEAESDTAYKVRLDNARFTNIWSDIVESLAQRPFGTEVAISDDAPEVLRTFCEDVDGAGNTLHVFAGSTFFNGIAFALDWILVDYTRGLGPAATRAQERAAGVRPIWSRYPAQSVLAAYSERIGGREEFVHVRLAETATVRVGWKEEARQRVRILNREPLDGGGYAPATWELWEKQAGDGGTEKWERIDNGAFSIGVIPLVPFIAGRRDGKSWRIKPPMLDAANLQIDYYQQENAIKNTKNLSAFPMLAGNGVSPVIGEDGKPEALIVGPGMVLYTGDGNGSPGSWVFVEPSATSLRFLADDLAATAKELRELGRQPLTADSGNLTVITTAFAAQKGNSAIQAWAINLRDALENALRFTAMWLRIPDEGATVSINTDFDLGMGDDDTFAHVAALYAGGTISREAMIHEAKRRGILDDDYDGDDDLDVILSEMDGNADDPSPQDLPPVTEPPAQ